MPKRTSSYHSWLIEKLKNSRNAESYLKTAMADSQEAFFIALRNVAEAHRMSKVAEIAGVNRESLYRTLSEEGNPRYDTLNSVLDALGIELTVRLKLPVLATEPTLGIAENEKASREQFRYDTGDMLESSTTWIARDVRIIFNGTPVNSALVPDAPEARHVPFCLIVAQDKTSQVFANLAS